MKRTVALVVAGIFLVGMVGYAHHSIGATYDIRKEVTLEGKVVNLQFRNPHSFVTIEAPDQNGKMQRWAIEWGSAGQLGGQNITSTTLKYGDELIITGNPSRVGNDHRVKMNTLHRKADGFGWGTRPGEVVD